MKKVRFISDLSKYKHYILFSVKATLKAELNNTVFGYIWWLLDPFLHMLIYTFLVNFVFSRGIEAFPLYVFTALLPWKVASNTMTRSTSVIRSNAGISKQIYLPQFIGTLVILLTNSIKLFFGLLIVFGMLFFYRISLSWHIFEIIPVYIVFFFFYFGVSLILTHMGVVFSDMRYLVGYLIMFWFFASPGMWSVDQLPEDFQRMILINPNVVFFEGFRNTIMYQKSPDYQLLLIWFGISVLLMIIGIRIIYTSEKNYTKVI